VRVLTLAVLLSTLSTAHVERIRPENYYQAKWCHKMHGQQEVVLPDKTRADCLTDTHAIEVNFANMWPEAIGQSLWCAMQTGMKVGIVLIVERPKDNCLTSAKSGPIEVKS